MPWKTTPAAATVALYEGAAAATMAPASQLSVSHRELLIFADGPRPVAFDLRAGTQAWSGAPAPGVVRTAHVCQEQLVVLSDGGAAAYDAATGARLALVEGAADVEPVAAEVLDGRLYTLVRDRTSGMAQLAISPLEPNGAPAKDPLSDIRQVTQFHFQLVTDSAARLRDVLWQPERTILVMGDRLAGYTLPQLARQ